MPIVLNDEQEPVTVLQAVPDTMRRPLAFVTMNGEVVCSACLHELGEQNTARVLGGLPIARPHCSRCGTFVFDSIASKIYAELALTAVERGVLPASLIELYRRHWSQFSDQCRLAEDPAHVGLVAPYRYKPAPQFHGMPPFLGVELELVREPGADSDGIAKKAEYLYRKRAGYIKSDSSIGPNGVEFVFEPRGWHSWRTEGVHALKVVTKEMRATGSCGLHVHVSRAGFRNKAHIMRFARCYDDSADVYGVLMPILDRRDRDWLFQYAEPTDMTERVASLLRGASRTRRSVAVNLTEKTVEVRIFGASTEVDRILAKIGHVQAALEFTRHCGGIKDVTEVAFCDYIRASDRFPELATLTKDNEEE